MQILATEDMLDHFFIARLKISFSFQSLLLGKRPRAEQSLCARNSHAVLSLQKTPIFYTYQSFFHSMHFNKQVYGVCWSWGWRLADTSEMELQWFSPCQGNPTHCCRPNPPGETKCLQTLYLCQVLFHLYSLPPQSFKKTAVSLGD